jgi:hypothetical protein
MTLVEGASLLTNWTINITTIGTTPTGQAGGQVKRLARPLR